MSQDSSSRARRARARSLFVATAVIATACGSGSDPDGVDRLDPGTVPPATAPSDALEVQQQPRHTPATIEVDAITIAVPETAFDLDVTWHVYETEIALDPEADGEPLGPALAFSTLDAEGKPHRPDDFIELTFEFDPSAITEAGEVGIAYHSASKGWTVFTPDHVDLEAGLATIRTDHLSPWRAVRLTTNQRVERFVKQEAAAAYVRSQAVDASEAQITAAVTQILRDGVGVGDSRVAEIVARAVVSKAPGGSIALALADLNAEAFGQAMLEETYKVLGEMVMDTESPVATALGSTGAIATALGSVSAGDYRAAARVIGIEVAKTFGAGNLVLIGQTAAQVVDHVVNDLWLEPSIEKAFEVYRDGADNLYGYSVPARDFDAVLEQMSPGALRQYQMNFRRTHALARGISVDSLSESQVRQLERDALATLKERFDARIERAPEIAAREEGLTAMFEAFRNRGMFHTSGSNPMVPEGAEVDMEMLMSRIVNFANKVQRDTERFTILPNDTFAARHDDKSALPAYIIASAALVWYTSPAEERERAYRDLLIAEGFLPPEEDEPDEMVELALEAAEAACTYNRWLAENPGDLWDQMWGFDVPGAEEMQALAAWYAEAREILREHGYGDYAMEVAMSCSCPDVVGTTEWCADFDTMFGSR